MQDNTRTGRKPCFLFACHASALYSDKLRIAAHKIVIFQNCIFLFSPPRSFFNIPFFYSCRCITPQKNAIFKNYHFSRAAFPIIRVFQNSNFLHYRRAPFPCFQILQFIAAPRSFLFSKIRIYRASAAEPE